MNNKKFFGVLIIILGLIIIAGIVYFLFFASFDIGSLFRGKETVEEVVEETPVIDTTIKSKKVAEITPVIEENRQMNTEIKQLSMSKEVLAQIATSFAERFGSYSNQSNYNNINDLKMFMSQKMSNWADSYIKDQKLKAEANDIYYGITTKAVSQEIKSFDDDIGRAVISIKTRRREALGTTNNVSKTYNQDILVTFVKEKEAWKVDSAYWQN